MLRLICAFLVLVLSLFLFHCGDSQSANFKAITSNELKCPELSKSLESVINFMQEKDAKIRWTGKIWDGYQITMGNDKKYAEWIIRMNNCNTMKQLLNKYVKKKENKNNPVAIILGIMNSKHFYVHEPTRNTESVEFYLNYKPIKGIFNSPTNVLTPSKTPAQRQTNSYAYALLKNKIENEIRGIKSELVKDIQALQQKLKKLESQDTFKTEYKILVILVIILYIISICLIITVIKISAKNEEIKAFYEKSLKKSNKNISSSYEVNNRLTDFDNSLKKLEGKINSLSSSKFSSAIKESSVPKKIKNLSIHSPTKKESSASQTNSTYLSEVSYKTKKADEFISEYHQSLSEGLEHKFIEKWNPKFIKILNIDDRMTQSDLEPHLDQVEDQRSADFWLIEFNERYVLVPSYKIYKNMSALTSSRGRGADAWFKRIFEIDQGKKYEIKKLAYYNYHREKEKWQTEQGLLTLPILSEVPSTKSKTQFGFGRD